VDVGAKTAFEDAQEFIARTQDRDHGDRCGDGDPTFSDRRRLWLIQGSSCVL